MLLATVPLLPTVAPLSGLPSRTRGVHGCGGHVGSKPPKQSPKPSLYTHSEFASEPGNVSTRAHSVLGSSLQKMSQPGLAGARGRPTLRISVVSGAHIVQETIRSMRKARGAFDRNRVPRTVGALDRIRERDPRDYVDFACYRLCMECGYLGDPLVSDPNRAHQGSFGIGHSCPACGQPALTDLAHTPTVLALCEVDAHDAPAQASWLSRLGSRAIGTLAVVASVSLVGFFLYTLASQRGVDLFYFLLWSGALMPLLATARVVQKQMAERSKAKQLPARWRLAAPGQRSLRGPATRGQLGCEQPMLAPLSRRPCAAYEIGVRSDDDPDGELGTWLLLEQRCGALKVAGWQLRPDNVEFRLRRTRFVPEQQHQEVLRRFLRQRGLNPNDELVVFETIVEVAAACEVRQGKRGVPIVTVTG